MNNFDIFESPQKLSVSINNTGYICDLNIVLPIYLGFHLNKCIILQGPPGCGKTEIAKVISNLLNNCDPIRLQCYEGISSSEAIYDWNYKKQLLYIEANKENEDWKNMKDDIYSEEFLSVRPLLKSILSNKKEVILIDELDKADEEFEAFLLEFLAEQQISISENMTIKAKNNPICFITSNDQRPISDAILRRCITIYIDYPSLERELEIIHTKVDGIDDLLATQVVKFVQLLRQENLKKIPSISETIDWVQALIKLEAKNLSPKLVKSTLNLLLKTKSDLELVEKHLNKFFEKLPKRAIKIEKQNNNQKRTEKIDNILNDNGNWEF